MAEISLTNESPQKETPEHEEQDLSLEQFIMDTCGANEYGKSKASLLATYMEAPLLQNEEGEYYPDTGNQKMKKWQTGITGAVLDLFFSNNIYCRNDYLIVDLTFPQSENTAFRRTWNELGQYMKKMNSFVQGSDVMPLFSLLACPNHLPEYYEHHDLYLLELTSPVYVTLSSDLPTFPSNKISFIFSITNCNIIKNEEIPNSSIIEEINKEIQKEVKRQQLIEEEQRRKEERRKAEFEAIKEERSKRFGIEEEGGRVLVGRTAEKEDGNGEE